MRIELASLERTDGKFAESFEPNNLAIDERVRLSEPLKVRGRVAQSKGKVVVTGEVESRLEVDCDRCLKPVELPVKSGFRVEYVTPQTYAATNVVELNESDMQLSVFDGETIDIDELVREQLLLSLPSRILCQEDCRGLCAVCGADSNIATCQCETGEVDPRWLALRELVSGK